MNRRVADCWLENIIDRIRLSIKDLKYIIEKKEYPLIFLARAYGLLSELSDYETVKYNISKEGELYGKCWAEGSSLPDGERADKSVFYGELRVLASLCNENRELIKELLDPVVLAQKSRAYLRPWEIRVSSAKRDIEELTALLEAATVAHQAEEKGSFIQRWKTLRRVRKMAGFKLERGRIGNYIARLEEQIHQAHISLRKLELATYDHNMCQKCVPEIYEKLAELIGRHYLPASDE